MIFSMEIFEVLALVDLCGCFLEAAALASNGTAAYPGYQTYRDRKRARQTETPPSGKILWRFLIILLIAVALLVLVISKWAVWIAG